MCIRDRVRRGYREDCPVRLVVTNRMHSGRCMGLYDLGHDESTAWNLTIRPQVQAVMPQTDLLFWHGHGNRGNWSVFDGASFGDRHPVVFSLSCLTGAYEGIYGAPESALRAGAAVFIGATEVTPAYREHSRDFALQFFSRWTPGTSVGDALLAAKAWAIEQYRTRPLESAALNDYFLFVAYEYNLYGDPRYGG